MALEPGRNYGDDLTDVPPESQPVHPPQPVADARQQATEGRGTRPEARYSRRDDTRWCVTCNTVLDSPRASYCQPCNRAWATERARLARQRRDVELPVTLDRYDVMALHQAKDFLGHLAWRYRAALTQDPRASIALGEDLLVAVKDITYLIDTVVPDVRQPQQQDRSWRRRLPMPQAEPPADAV